MLPKLSRYSLIVVSIVVLAAILPQIYNTLFDVRINLPYITYSTVADDFFIMKSNAGKTYFKDTEGNEYTQKEFLKSTPISNYFYLVANGGMPDSIKGVKITVPKLRREGFRLMLRPQRYSAPEYHLYPLFESEPEFGLSFPKDFFRINNRIEFIDAKTNTIEEEKSQLFTEALLKNGFEFPANLVAGIPSIMKSRADGWFITDRTGKLYHLKMVKGSPYVKHISTPAGFDIKAIFCTDFNNREFYALMVTQDNRLFLLGIPDYKLTEIPIYDYKPLKQKMLFSGNLFDRTFTLVGNSSVKAYSLDRDYKIIDTYSEGRPVKSEMLMGKVFDYLFPFYINFEIPESKFIQFNINGYANYYWIYLNIILFGLTFFLIKKGNKRLSNIIPDLIIVAVTGLFGFIVIHLFPNKEF